MSFALNFFDDGDVTRCIRSGFHLDDQLLGCIMCGSADRFDGSPCLCACHAKVWDIHEYCLNYLKFTQIMASDWHETDCASTSHEADEERLRLMLQVPAMAEFPCACAGPHIAHGLIETLAALVKLHPAEPHGCELRDDRPACETVLRIAATWDKDSRYQPTWIPTDRIAAD